MDNLGGATTDNKGKAIFILGATATGKSQLSVDLATRLPAEIINSDKIQTYKGLQIITNKLPHKERRGVPHHLLDELHPEADFTADDFCRRTLSAMSTIFKTGRTPIIVGGSNNYIMSLVEDPGWRFREDHDCLFLWLDVSPQVLHARVDERVDEMMGAGAVEEVRALFVPDADYGRGIRRAIGVPELDEYLRSVVDSESDKEECKKLLEDCIEKVKVNTCRLADLQVEKIRRLRNELGWDIHRMDATDVLEKRGREREDAWWKLVLKPSLDLVTKFLNVHEQNAYEYEI